MDDKSLRQQIIDELEWDPRVDAERVGVAVHDGVATLTGTVPFYAQRVAAEAAVKRVKGVKAVAEEIEVHFDGVPPQSDEDIAGRAASLLKWSAVVPDRAIDISVTKGWVTLGGNVEWDYQRRKAEASVRDLAGVRGVVNNIAVRPRVQAGDVTSRIQQAFTRDAQLEAGQIKVSVTGGRVKLEGHVKNWQERNAAERAAWAAPGVSAVEDFVTVG